MTRGCRVSAFTLIEMLITVGILCILAAIAIPNALEAQTRAKVARVKNDQRVIAEALEQFWNANEAYPVPKTYCGLHRKCELHPNQPNHTQCERREAYWFYNAVALTTPIAYLTTTDHTDPFIRARAHRHMPNGSMVLNRGGPSNPPDPDDFEIVPAIEANMIDVPLSDEHDPVHKTFMYAVNIGYARDHEEEVSEREYLFGGRAEKHEFHRPGYYLISVGPDHVSGPDALSGQIWNALCYLELNDHAEGRKNTFEAWQYDPSNGTQSAGDIVRSGPYFED